MELPRDVAEGISQCHFFLVLRQPTASVGRSTDTGLKLRVDRQLSTGEERLFKHIVIH